jgi:hypothetical protein
VEIVETVITEIVNEDIFQLDCTTLMAKVFGLQAGITGDDKATMISEFEHGICTKYQHLFKDPTGLPLAGKDGSFRIHLIPVSEST